MCAIRQSLKARLLSWGVSFAVILPTLGRAEWSYSTNNGAITIGRYFGSDTTLVIPEYIADLPVTGIGIRAFNGNRTLMTVVIPSSVTRIETSAFNGCTNLTSVNLPRSVTAISGTTFAECAALTGIAIHDGITSIGSGAFRGCIGLTGLTIPGSVTNIGSFAFSRCTNLEAIYFRGNAKDFGVDVFSGADRVVVHYLPGTMGWGATFAGRSTALWIPITPSLASVPEPSQLRLVTHSPAPKIVRVQRSANLLLWDDWQTVLRDTGPSELQDDDALSTPCRYYRGIEE